MKGQMNIYYDEELDYLTIFAGEPRPNYGEAITEEITIFKDQKTNEVLGIGIQEFKEKTHSLEEIKLKLPFEISFSNIKNI